MSITIEFEAKTKEDITNRVKAFRLLFGKRPSIRVTSPVVSVLGDALPCDKEEYLVLNLGRTGHVLLRAPDFSTVLISLWDQPGAIRGVLSDEE